MFFLADEQPPRQAGDPGPGWRTRFGWRRAALWTGEGFLIPMAVYAAIWAVAMVWSLADQGVLFNARAVRTGALFAGIGFFLTGGSIVLTSIFMVGARWSSLFRVIGLTIAVILQWELNALVLQWEG